MCKPSKATIDIWIALTRAHQNILASIEDSLKLAGMPPLEWYDVLLELDRAGTKGERAFIIQKQLLLPQYSLSRLLSRIENAGYLKRQACKEDGRSQRLVITSSGKDVRQKIWAVYAEAMQKAIGEKLSAGDIADLSRSLRRLV